MNNLAPKGDKRVNDILALGSDSKNGELLMSLISTEKGKCKQAVLKALAQFDYAPAIPVWQKVFKSKSKGEKIFMESTTDSISDIIASDLYTFLSKLVEQPEGYVLTQQELSNLNIYISLMLGKASNKMLDIYSLAAQNADKLSTFNFNQDNKGLFINSYLRFFEPKPEDIKKIFPAILSMSVLKTMDERLIKLADELYLTYKSNWISPVFMIELLTSPAKSVFERFSGFLSGESAYYLYDVLGSLYYNSETQRHTALLFWGQVIYGE